MESGLDYALTVQLKGHFLAKPTHSWGAYILYIWLLISKHNNIYREHEEKLPKKKNTE